ncbi:hypothetical protein AHF37_10022 [Paragonimus kellicotti]|nr:hypothetical protein AHF37_10022 [Paragonimus kellicotti]
MSKKCESIKTQCLIKELNKVSLTNVRKHKPCYDRCKTPNLKVHIHARQASINLRASALTIRLNRRTEMINQTVLVILIQVIIAQYGFAAITFADCTKKMADAASGCISEALSMTTCRKYSVLAMLAEIKSQLL